MRRRATVDLPDVMIGAEVVYRITPWTGGIRIYLGENDPTPITTLTAPGGRAWIPLGEPSTFYWEPTSEDVTFRYHVIGWKDNLSRDPRDVAIRRWLAGG